MNDQCNYFIFLCRSRREGESQRTEGDGLATAGTRLGIGRRSKKRRVEGWHGHPSPSQCWSVAQPPPPLSQDNGSPSLPGLAH